MKAPMLSLPVLAAGLLALPGGPRALVAQTVVLPPAEPPAEAPATEVPAEEVPAVTADAVDTPVEAVPGDTPAPAPGSAEPMAPELGESAPDDPDDANDPDGEDSSRAAGDAEEMRERKAQEMRDLAPLPSRPVNKEEDAFLPASYSPQRYAPTWSDSAFTREIVPEVVAGPEIVNDLEKYILTGIGTIGGSYFVTSLSPTNESQIIRTEPKEEGGLFVVSVDRAAKMSDSTVTISDGRQTGRIKFDSKRLSAPPKTAVALNLPGAQGAQGAQGRQGRGQGNVVGAGAVGTPQQQAQQQAMAQAQAQAAAAQQQAQQAQMTPQQQQEAAAAQQQASEQLIQHLRDAAQNPAAAAPAQGNTPQGGAAGEQPRRRRVILPPAGGR